MKVMRETNVFPGKNPPWYLYLGNMDGTPVPGIHGVPCLNGRD